RLHLDAHYTRAGGIRESGEMPLLIKASIRVAVAHPLQIDLELVDVLRTPAAAVELCALLDRQRHVVDVALDARGGLQRHRHPANDAGDPPAHDHALGGDGARDPALLADDDFGAGHVALDLAVDLQRALADDLQALADDLQVVADHRLVAGVRPARHSDAGALARTGAGRHRLERLGLRLRVA